MGKQHFLKFDTEAKALTALTAAGLAQDGIPNPVTLTAEGAVFVVVLGDLSTSERAVSGWHVNIGGPLPKALEAFAITPAPEMPHTLLQGFDI